MAENISITEQKIIKASDNILKDLAEVLRAQISLSKLLADIRKTTYWGLPVYGNYILKQANLETYTLSASSEKSFMGISNPAHALCR